MSPQRFEDIRWRERGDTIFHLTIPIETPIDHQVGQQPSGKRAVLGASDLARLQIAFFGRAYFVVCKSLG